jgi:hypothetical protein
VFPSVKKLSESLNISTANARLIRSAMDAGQSVQKVLRLADKIMDAHGVEYIQSGEDTMYDKDGLDYVNMGDTYDTTLIFDHRKGRFIVSSWGDIVERDRTGRFDG